MFFCRFKEDFGVHCTQMGYKTQCNPCFLIWLKALLISILFLFTIGGADANNRERNTNPTYSGITPWSGYSKPVAQPKHQSHRRKASHPRHSGRRLFLRHKTISVSPKATGDLVTVPTAAGIPITVAKKLAPQFQGFVADLVEKGYTPKHIGCYASRGHVANSNHYHGGACDFDQTGWGRTASPMYHVSDLTAKWGLRDGCSFRKSDCGHVDDGSNMGWKHPNNLIARYVDHQTSPKPQAVPQVPQVSQGNWEE